MKRNLAQFKVAVFCMLIWKGEISTVWMFVCCVRISDWFHAVQAMVSIGLIMLLVAFLLIAIYMCVHTVSKNSTIIALVCFCFLAGKSINVFPLNK